jgi:hypothetical protein
VIVPGIKFYFRVGIRRLAENRVPRGIDKNYAQVWAKRDFRWDCEKDLQPGIETDSKCLRLLRP